MTQWHNFIQGNEKSSLNIDIFFVVPNRVGTRQLAHATPRRPLRLSYHCHKVPQLKYAYLGWLFTTTNLGGGEGGGSHLHDIQQKGLLCRILVSLITEIQILVWTISSQLFEEHHYHWVASKSWRYRSSSLFHSVFRDPMFWSEFSASRILFLQMMSMFQSKRRHTMELRSTTRVYNSPYSCELCLFLDRFQPISRQSCPWWWRL